MIALGLMSGTSLDGIDAAVVAITPRGPSYGLQLRSFVTVPYEEELAGELRGALPPNTATVAMLARLHRRVGAAFARAARAAAGDTRVDYVASHGQTLWHDGENHLTVQIGDPFVIREALDATVCFDFRSADCALGGHGAPLVPYVDAMLFTSPSEDRVALNLGGIANVTMLPAGANAHDVVAFDTGPANMLIDAFVRRRTNGAHAFDAGGRFAAAGSADRDALDAFLRDPYFALDPPKSTGRERFGEQWLDAHAERLAALSLEDGAATLTELTAASIASALQRVRADASRIIASGGGAHNAHLLERLQARLPKAAVETSDGYGIPADAKEAIAFAVLGYETLRERAANVPRVTGASRAVPLGAIAPVRLAHIISEVERECRSL